MHQCPVGVFSFFAEHVFVTANDCFWAELHMIELMVFIVDEANSVATCRVDRLPWIAAYDKDMLIDVLALRKDVLSTLEKSRF